jgi:hypothetical protein
MTVMMVPGRTAIVTKNGFKLFEFFVAHFANSVSQVKHLLGAHTSTATTVPAATTMARMHDNAKNEQPDEHFGHKECQNTYKNTADDGSYNCSCHLISFNLFGEKVF